MSVFDVLIGEQLLHHLRVIEVGKAALIIRSFYRNPRIFLVNLIVGAEIVFRKKFINGFASVAAE
jgi:hypothetical protein